MPRPFQYGGYTCHAAEASIISRILARVRAVFLPEHGNSSISGVLPFPLRTLILGPLAILLLVLVAFFFIVSMAEEEKHIAEDAHSTFQSMSHAYDSALQSEADKLSAAAEIILRDDALRGALAAQDRNALMQRAAPIFERLRERHRITHFYFQLPNRVNLLRVHQPERFGDLIDRYTTLQAEARGKPFHGVELGPLGTFTLRIVLPWRERGRLIGYLELGEEIDHVLHRLYYRSSLSRAQSDMYVLIDKTRLKRAEWEEGMRMLRRKSDWNLMPSAVLSYHGNNPPNTHILKKLGTSPAGQVEKLFVNGRHIWFTSLPLLDAARHEVGQMLIQRDMTERIADNYHAMMTLAGICTMLGGMLLLFFYVLTGKVERKLEASRLQLVQHVREKEALQARHIRELEQEHDRLLRAQHELIQAKELAEQSSRAKSVFLSRVSHELRTPMNAILGFAQLMESDLDDKLSPGQSENLGEILTSGWHLHAMITDLLDITRIEAGTLQVTVGAVELVPLLQECTHLVLPAAAKRGIQVNLNVSSCTGLSMLADRLRLKQVVLNLLSNAIKYNRDQGSVQIGCELAANNMLRLSIRDTGKGLTAENLAKLFTPFTRLDAEEMGIEGIGIGLAISKQLIELMHGRIGASSEPGQGSIFWIELPPAATQA